MRIPRCLILLQNLPRGVVPREQRRLSETPARSPPCEKRFWLPAPVKNFPPPKKKKIIRGFPWRTREKREIRPGGWGASPPL